MGERPLTATYRLQLHADFTFTDAEHVVPYLADLGVSHLYLSPILSAAPGSMHGYDVVDHGRVSEDLGGEPALLSLADTAHAHGLGIVCDVVPNHMCIPEPEYLNRQLWDVLRHGREAPSASWFDIDWDLLDGRLGLPVLGAALAEVIDAGELVLDKVDTAGGSEAVLRYHGHVFPVADGTDDGSVADIAGRQHYLLGSWRDKRSLLSHRRFFDVDTLIAVRVEDPKVFDTSHSVLIDLHRRGVLDGFRIDHPDGLADPEAYLARLAAATDGAWVVVEKILEGNERLPQPWATAGSTGYDALNVIQTALAPRTGSRLDALWQAAGAEGEAASAPSPWSSWPPSAR
ncbi:MAG: alpha-amylase family glycosyl hydrolase [Nocardioidaceae bacterium]